jgi:hypothetical protein
MKTDVLTARCTTYPLPASTRGGAFSSANYLLTGRISVRSRSTCAKSQRNSYMKAIDWSPVSASCESFGADTARERNPRRRRLAGTEWLYGEASAKELAYRSRVCISSAYLFMTQCLSATCDMEETPRAHGEGYEGRVDPALFSSASMRRSHAAAWSISHWDARSVPCASAK